MPWRASLTRVTASGNTVAMTARSCCACCSVVPWTLTRWIAATVMSTASLIALSAHARVWADCMFSAISCMRRWNSGSLRNPPKPSIEPSLLGAVRRLGGAARGRGAAARGRLVQRLRLAGVLALPRRDRAAQRGERDRARSDREPEGEEAVGEHGDDREARVGPERDQRADHAAVDSADAAREREEVRECADEVGHDQDADRRRLAERLEARPQDGDVEAPPEDRAEQAEGAGLHQVLGVAHALADRRDPAAEAAVARRDELEGPDRRDHDEAEDRGDDGDRERAAARDQPEVEAKPADDQRGHVDEIEQDEERRHAGGDVAPLHAGLAH